MEALCQNTVLVASVATFLSQFYIVGNKIPKTTGILDDVDHPKKPGVLIGPKKLATS